MMKSLSQYSGCERSITRRANKMTKTDPLFATRLTNSPQYLHLVTQLANFQVIFLSPLSYAVAQYARTGNLMTKFPL